MKIAIVKLSALGDIVHAMTVIQFIKRYDHNIQIDWVVEAHFSGLLDCHPDIKNIHKVNFKKAKQKKSLFLLIREFRRVRKFGSYDLVIDMQGLIKSAIVSRLITSPITIGFDRYSSRENIASFFYNKTFHHDYGENVIERNIAIIKFALELKISKQEIKHKIPFLYSSQIFLNSTISNIKKNIVLIPGASHKSKRYPVAKLAKLTTLIDANFIIIWGDSKEKILANAIKSQAPNVNVCEKLSIDSLKSLISQVDLVIGPDTGPTHMAWALNIPSIILFGPTPGYRNTYTTNINKSIESKSKVNPYKINKMDFSIKNIPLDEIVKISQLLFKNK
jgi:heptosyltransferase-1